MTNRDFIHIIRLSRPLNVASIVLLYILGVGISRYLGEIVRSGPFWLGLLWLLTLQLGAVYLADYFQSNPGIEWGAKRSPFTPGSEVLGPGKLPRQFALWASLVSLTVTSSLSVLLLSQNLISPQTLIILVFLLAGYFLYALPPSLANRSGYGELVISILVANMVPAFGYLLQAGELHRLLAMATFPLTALHLAMVIAYGFPDFGQNVKYELQTLLVKMGWRQGMTLHNLLILTAYLLLGLAVLFDLPAPIGLPAFMFLPLGILQIWYITRIGSGARPNWRALNLTAATLFLGTAYLLTYAFWTR